MIKSIPRKLSFAFMTLASATMLSASERGAASASADASRAGCAVPSEVDRGWAEQLALVEKRGAAKEAEGLAVPGAIITPPFETFAPYRTDVPAGVAANQAGRALRPDSSNPAARD